MKTLKTTIALFLSLLLAFGLTASAFAAGDGIVLSGTAGDGVTWQLTDDGVLTVSGSGPIVDKKEVEYDEDGTPVLAMTDERFVSVVEKIFAMTYDNNARFKTSEDSDVPTPCRDMFATGHSLFLDCSLFWVAALRDMETDFGIIPYPKYDENQADYCARVSYYMPPMIPVTNGRMELTGAVLEETNYRAKLHITPAYYEICLKGKYSRDPESISMLDLIFQSRVLDLGDSLFCSSVRDGFAASMYSADNRDLISTVAKNEKVINKTVSKLVEGLKG